MRDRIERFVLLPFSMGCVSESSIAIGGQIPNRRKQNANSIPSNVEGTRGDDKEEEEENEDDDESLSEENLKSTLSILAVPRFQRLFKNFKNLSQLFVYKDEEMEEENLGMEIGLPTDVKHVTHIGIDGSATSILSKGWDVLQAPDLSALPSLHLPPFEFAMPAQADKINVTGTNQDELSALPSVHLRSFEFAMTAQAYLGGRQIHLDQLKSTLRYNYSPSSSFRPQVGNRSVKPLAITSLAVQDSLVLANPCISSK